MRIHEAFSTKEVAKIDGVESFDYITDASSIAVYASQTVTESLSQRYR